MFFSVVNSKFRSIVTVVPYGSRSIPYGLYVEIQEWHTHSHSSSPSLVALHPRQDVVPMVPDASKPSGQV